MPLFFVYFSYFYLTDTYNHTITFIQYIRRGPSPSPHRLVGQTSLWCRAGNRTRACLPASRRATNWATPQQILYRARICFSRHKNKFFVPTVPSPLACGGQGCDPRGRWRGWRRRRRERRRPWSPSRRCPWCAWGPTTGERRRSLSVSYGIYS